MVSREEVARQKEYLQLREKEIELQEGLPHLYGWKWYSWAKEFFDSKNKLNFLCAANQISKSSTQIRKVIDWATDKSKWKELWPTWRVGEPIQFWYLYPTRDQCKIEFDMKWKQFLPNGAYKTHPIYGWKEEYVNKQLFAVHFNSGAHIFFKTYAQNVDALQTGTCHAIFCDEELPVELYEELIFRISAAEGYFHMVFTATLGQEYWRLVIDPGPNETELLPEAYKRTVSMYECLEYADGSPATWTLEKIKTVEQRCSSHTEVLKRVHGKFIKLEGLIYPTFDLKRHIIPGHEIPADWSIYGAADIGSGGENGHPSAIAFVAVSPDNRQGRVFFGWRGDKIVTTAGDVVQKFLEMRGEKKLQMTQQLYDWGCKDFSTISTRMGEAFLPANKNHEIGEGIINTLFKNDMLFIFDDTELKKLGSELSSLRIGQNKTKAKDDFVDAMRYAVSAINWDFSGIIGLPADGTPAPDPNANLTPTQIEVAERRRTIEDNFKDGAYSYMEAEFDEVNYQYES